MIRAPRLFAACNSRSISAVDAGMMFRLRLVIVGSASSAAPALPNRDKSWKNVTGPTRCVRVSLSQSVRSLLVGPPGLSVILLCSRI